MVDKPPGGEINIMLQPQGNWAESVITGYRQVRMDNGKISVPMVVIADNRGWTTEHVECGAHSFIHYSHCLNSTLYQKV